jgi:O-antigen ligase
VLAGALLASESRGALLAGALAVTVVLAFASRRWYRLIWPASLAGLLAAWLATLGLVPAGEFSRVLDAVGLGGVSFGHVTDANFSAVERAAHWLAGVRMFADHPLLGVGIGNYAAAYPAYHPRGWYAALAHAHNYYINVAAEAGVIGLAAYVLLAGSALWYSYAAIRQSSGNLSAVPLGVLGALVAISFHNLFDVLYVHGMVALLGLLMVLLPASLRLGILQSTGAPDPHPST